MTGEHAELALLALFGQLPESICLTKVQHLLLGVGKEQVQATQHDKGQCYLLVVALLECLYQHVVGNVPEECEELVVLLLFHIIMLQFLISICKDTN